MFEHLLSSDDDSGSEDDDSDSNAPVIQSATEDFAGGGSETTYFLDGAVIGYSESYGSLEEGYKSTEYYDANHAPLGDSWEDSYGGSGSSFNIILAADEIPLDGDGDPVVDAGLATHVIQQTSQSTYIEGDMTDSSSSVHYYVAALDGDDNPTGEIDWSASPSHLGGQDIYNGVTTNWGAGWENLGQSLGDFSFTDAVADPDSGYTAVGSTDGLPSAFSTAAYMYEDSHGHDDAGDDYGDGGDTHITYYDDAGVILGFEMTTQSDYGSNTQFTMPDNITSLGSEWSNESETGYRFVIRGTDDDDGSETGVAAADNGNQPVNYRLEQESRTEVGSDSPYFVRDLIFNEDTGLLISGTGIDGSTETEWGADWEIVSETVSLTGLEVYDTSSLDSAFFDGYVASSITDENPDIFAIVDDYDQNTVHLVNGAGAEIGHISSYGAEGEEGYPYSIF